MKKALPRAAPFGLPGLPPTAEVRDEEAEAVKQYMARAEKESQAMSRNDQRQDGQVQQQAWSASRLPL